MYVVCEIMWVCMYRMHARALWDEKKPSAPQELELQGLRATCGCRNQTWVLHRSGKSSTLLSHLSSCYNLSLQVFFGVYLD